MSGTSSNVSQNNIAPQVSSLVALSGKNSNIAEGVFCVAVSLRRDGDVLLGSKTFLFNSGEDPFY